MEEVKEKNSGSKYYNLENSNKKIWIFVGAFVIIIIALIIFLMMRLNTDKVTSEELTEGSFVNLDSAKEFNFDLDEEEHKIVLDALGGDYVDLTIQSDPIKFRIKIGETKKFDLDGDGEYDLLIRLESIVDGVPNIYIKNIKRIRERVRDIKEEQCKEKWNCSRWSNCVEGIKNRNCSDLNNCNTEKNRPSERRECIQLDINQTNKDTNKTSIHNNTFNDCEIENGTICNSTQVCEGDWLDESDGKSCCFGECVEITNEIDSCEDKGKYSIDEDRNYLCDSFYSFNLGSEAILCCNEPPTYGVELTDELRDVWNSIQNYGNCTSFNYKLSSCLKYKCSFIHPLSGENLEKGIIGYYDDKCHSLEEMPNSEEQYCAYNDSQLLNMVEYYVFHEEQCGNGNCSITSNESGYFINGMLTENTLQDMYGSGDCVASFG